MMAHYLRNLRPGTPVLNMTGRFLDWGDFGSLRPAESLKFDLLYGLANGMRPNIGGHLHPRGDLDLPVFDRIYEVYSDLQKREKWFSGAEPNTEIAILYSGKELEMASSPEIRGLVRMLEELKYQYDIVLPEPLKKRYRVLLVPDTELPGPEACALIRKHLKEGGAAFFCGENSTSSLIRCRNTRHASAWLNSCIITPGAVAQTQKRIPNTSMQHTPNSEVTNCSTIPAISGGSTPAASRYPASSAVLRTTPASSPMAPPYPRKMKNTAPAMQIAA